MVLSNERSRRVISAVGSWCFLSILLSSTAVAGSNYGAKLALHVKSHPTVKAPPICDRADWPPCNDNESSLNVIGQLTGGVGTFDVYVLALDGDSTAGIGGATFGIEYDGATASGVDVRSWTKCTSLEYPGDGWPASGTGVLLTWDAETSCQRYSSPDDSLRHVTAVLGVFYVAVYGQDRMEIEKNLSSGEAVAISDCASATDEIEIQDIGSASFGNPSGYDPCKGPFAPFSRFEQMNSTELATLQAKLTYCGPLSYRWQSILLVPTGFTPVHELYNGKQRTVVNYSADRNPITVDLSIAELDALLSAVSDLPDVRDGGFDDNGFLSVSFGTVINDSSLVFESILDSSSASQFFDAVIPLVQENRPAYSELTTLACGLDVLSGSPPQDVTGDLALAINGFRLIHEPKLFVTTLTATNTGSATISAPLSIVLNEGPAGVQLVEPESEGRTCMLLPIGKPYFTLPVGSGLGPNESVDILLKFRNPNLSRITLTPKVYAGTGPR